MELIGDGPARQARRGSRLKTCLKLRAAGRTNAMSRSNGFI